MKKISDYLKLAIFVVGILVGVQIPGFVDQYGKNLNSRVSESTNSVAAFQGDANKYFAGDLNRLVKHYGSKSDPVIVSGGESIGALVARNQLLTKAQQSYSESAYSPYVQVFLNPIEEIRNEVWNNYTYQIVLNGSAIVIAIAAGLVALGLSDLLFYLLARLAQRLTNRTKRSGKTVKTSH